MNYIKLTITGCLMLVASVVANAQSSLTAGIGVMETSIYEDMDFGISYLSYSYEFDIAPIEGFSVAPVLRAGKGFTNISKWGLDIKINYLASAGLRLQYQVESFQFYLNPMYTKMSVDFDRLGELDDTELGLGFGTVYQINKRSGVEFGFEFYDGAKAANVGYVFSF